MKKNILILTHDWGGGTERFLNDYISSLVLYNVHILRPEIINNELVYIFTDMQTGKKSGYIYNHLLSAEDLVEKVRELKIDEIFINHLITFDLGLIVQFIITTELPFTFFLHDYHCICHNFRLTCGQKYCKDLKNNICNKPFSEGDNINVYQHVWRILLEKAENIISPSSYAAEIFRKNYPGIPIQVKPHNIMLPLSYTFDECNIKMQEKLNIVFLGTMDKDKGLDYIIKIDDYVSKNHLPINVILLGEINADKKKRKLNNIKITGKYKAEDVSILLRDLKTSLVGVLSTWAETYCYTASEAILSGYPVLSFDIGAHADRIKKYNCGWILPLEYDNALFDWLEYIVTPQGRENIIKKSRNTRLFINGT